MRKLATVRKILAIEPIENADAIESAIVDGWSCVVKKGEFSVGELALYLEIDCFAPHWLAPFLSKGKEPREYNGVKGERLRTVKLRGKLSQGLLIKLEKIDNNPIVTCVPKDTFIFVTEGQDLTDYLEIQKWEPYIPAQLAGQIKSLFPSFISKTDQERVQNLVKEVQIWKELGISWEVTEKLDGSSMTVYVNGNDSGVCSRNLDLKEDENNSFWKVAIREGLIDKIKSLNRNLAFQGELIGEGIQKNPYNLKDQDFYLFDIYNIDTGKYLDPIERQEIAKKLSIKTVPFICNFVLRNDTTISDILKFADGKSHLNGNTDREGLVFKANDGSASFKAISNVFLLGEK